jgi:hypothetical protein
MQFLNERPSSSACRSTAIFWKLERGRALLQQVFSKPVIWDAKFPIQSVNVLVSSAGMPAIF